jgi:hypothetical protein
LLIGGCLLCVWVVWAAVGFLLMGFGLICLQIAERNKARSAELTAAHFDDIDRRREPSQVPEQKTAPSAGSTVARPENSEPEQESSLSAEPKPAPVLPERGADRQQDAIDPCPYDKVKWRALLENDADIARSAAALAPFGEKYVAELATAYLVLNDKEYLPMIFKKIASAVRKDPGRDVATAAATDSHPNTDVISFALGKIHSSAAERAFGSPAVEDARTNKLVLVSNTPSIRLDTMPKPGTAQSDARTSAGQPEGRTSGAVREYGAEASDARRDARTAAIAHARRQATAAPGPDDVQDLTELFNRLDSGSSLRAKS